MLNKISTYRKLGISNLVNVFFYRLKKITGLHEKKMPVYALSSKPLFGGGCARAAVGEKAKVLQQANSLLRGEFIFFSCQKELLNAPPKWRASPENVEVSDAIKHWSSIPDFNPAVGDIKQVWEPSRFDWLLVFARAFCHSGDALYLETINHWLIDWCCENPVNGGPNWKCGQEVSIRLMQTLLAAFLLGEDKEPQQSLVDFVLAHCHRIMPTLRYGMAQDNNHGTSEAAALFIAGAWLRTLPATSTTEASLKDAMHFVKTGRKWLNNRAYKLIASDGSFSQYSVNYHRVMLDTLSMAEFWRQRLGEAPFTSVFYQKARGATEWLRIMTCPETGDAPNMGANDGARLFLLSETDYRDFRPSVQLANSLFKQRRVYPAGVWDQPLDWLGITVEKYQPPERSSRLFDQGGYCFLSNHTSSLELYIRYPRFGFRPSQADLLHLDLWFKGKNIIRDAGSYSYNTDEPWQSYFPGTESHSTVQFDDRDQMSRLGRFLFSNWLSPDRISSITAVGNLQQWSCGYRDAWGGRHHRDVCLRSNRLIVIDTIRGFSEKAVLRWRLLPGNWSQGNNTITRDDIKITISSNCPIKRMELVTGYEARYYNKKTQLPVLEIEVDRDAVVTSTFDFG